MSRSTVTTQDITLLAVSILVLVSWSAAVSAAVIKHKEDIRLLDADSRKDVGSEMKQNSAEQSVETEYSQSVHTAPPAILRSDIYVSNSEQLPSESSAIGGSSTQQFEMAKLMPVDDATNLNDSSNSTTIEDGDFDLNSTSTMSEDTSALTTNAAEVRNSEAKETNNTGAKKMNNEQNLQREVEIEEISQDRKLVDDGIKEAEAERHILQFEDVMNFTAADSRNCLEVGQFLPHPIDDCIYKVCLVAEVPVKDHVVWRTSVLHCPPGLSVSRVDFQEMNPCSQRNSRCTAEYHAL